ncbi:hypothetical protein HDE_05267 [Halotydeus destructor]|nr:hypothetical protein HDE_05267 [Halotydeus destructor]
MLIGPKLVRTRTVFKVVQLTILLVILVVTAIDVLINFHEGWELDSDKHELKLQTIRYTVRAVFPMLVQLVMVFKVRQLQILLEDILQHVDRVDKVKIKKISVVSLVAVYITIVVSITCRAQLFVSGLEDETAYQAFSHFLGVESLPWYHKVFYLYLDIIHRPLFEQHWIQVSVILYSVYMLAIYFAETSLIVEPHKMADKGYLRKTAAQKMTLMELNGRLNRHLSWLPLLWFAMIFLQSCGLILHLKQGVTDPNNVRRLIQFSCEMFFAFAGLALAIKVTSGLRLHTKANMAKLVFAEDDSCGQHCSHLKFMHTLNQNGDFDGVLFTLDRPLVLGFAGSLITFTVMFIQFNQSSLN